MSKVSDKILKRVYLLFGAVALFSVVILFRVVQIQYVQKDKWVSLIEKDRVYEKRVRAARGNILSDEGKVLATSQPFFRLPIDPTGIDTTAEEFPAQLDSLSHLLAARFGSVTHDAQAFHDKIMERIRARDRHHFLVRDKVDYEDYKIIREWPLLRNSKYQGGLILHKQSLTRFYPYDSLARITLGVMMHDTIPLKGIEFALHDQLKGVEGVSLVQRIAGGDEMPLEIFQEDVDGADVETTLNVRMQDIVEKELRQAVLHHQAKYGVAILMETHTGEIKAIANYPEVQNHAVATRIEPGSTFKLAAFLAALEDRQIDLDDTLDTGNGTQEFFGEVMRDHVALGRISYREGFEKSSNVLTSNMVTKIYQNNLERWFSHLEKFGLMHKVMPSEHIVGEQAPILIQPDDPDWVATTLPWMSIGYNSQLTPLQILTFYNAVANQGKLIEPTLVRRVRKGSRTIKEYKPQVLNAKIASDQSLALAQELLEGVVERGTARRLRIPECKLAGKTGTAKKINPETGRYEKVYQASFCGYFPADAPRYTCYVMIDEPSAGEYYGATVAGPVFREIARQVYIADLAMVPRFHADSDAKAEKPVTDLVNQKNAKEVYADLEIKAPQQAEATYVRTREEAGKIKFSRLELPSGKVPNVRGMTARDAVALLEGLGLRVALDGHGKVRSQSIAAGAALAPSTTITLTLN
ncbi:MAG: penicillin-binding transpeptidase domain-containing protein [Bacteroidota bacterium]